MRHQEGTAQAEGTIVGTNAEASATLPKDGGAHHPPLLKDLTEGLIQLV